MFRSMPPSKQLIHAMLLLMMTILASGCHRSVRLLEPRTYQDDYLLPQHESSIGNAYAYEHKIRGDILLARGNIEDAVTEYQSAVTADPGDSWIQIQYAEALIREPDLERARIHVAKAIQFNPANSRAWTTAARLHHMLGDEKNAVAAATFGAQVDKNDISALRWLGNHLARSQDNEKQTEALYCYQRALVRNQNSPELYLAASKTALQLHHTNLAKRYLIRYIQLYGTDYSITTNTAVSLAESGQSAAAIDILRTLLDRNPLADDIRKHLVALYLQTHQFPNAVNTVLSFFEAPDSPELIEERTAWLLAANAPWEARTLLVDHFSASPVHPVVRYQLARIESVLQRDELALALLNFENDIPKPIALKADALRKEISARHQ